MKLEYIYFGPLSRLFKAVKSVLECLFGASDRILAAGPKGMFPGIGESVIVLYSFKI